MSFAPKISSIKGLSDRRRLPRAGKIHLGMRVKKGKPDSRCKHDPNEFCNFCTYPKETEYFMVPKEVAKVYGDKPTAIDVVFPVNDLEVICPQAYKLYGGNGSLKCTGDLEKAYRFNEQTKQVDEIPCPCDLKDKKCTKRTTLYVILPKVTWGAVYQIDSGSYNSMIDIRSGLDYIQALVGRFSGIRLVMSRVPTPTYHDGMRQIHYPLSVRLETSSEEYINRLRETRDRMMSESRPLLPPAETPGPDQVSEPISVEWKEEESGLPPKEEPVTELPPVTGQVQESEGMQKFLNVVMGLVKQIGDSAAVSKTLGNFGFESLQEISQKEDQVKFYRALRAMLGEKEKKDEG